MEALKMEREMTHWNDDRLDELNGRMKEGFAEVDKRFEQVDKRFEQVDQRFEQVATKEEMGEIRGQLNGLNERFDRFLFILLATCMGLLGSFLVAVLGLFLQS
jgi:hypothetical protein